MATTSSSNYHYYAFDAAQLLETCIDSLQKSVELDTKGSHTVLYELKEALVRTECLLQDYFFQILQTSSNDAMAKLSGDNDPPSLAECTAALRDLMEIQRNNEQATTVKHPGMSKKHTKIRHHNPSPARSVTDTLLFRLIVALQLCLVRIDDAHLVIAGFRRKREADSPTASARRRRRRKWMVNLGLCGGVLGVTAYLLKDKNSQSSSVDTKEGLQTLAKVGTSAFLCFEMGKQWQSGWMASKLVKSTTELEEWQEQWLLVEYEHNRGGIRSTHDKSMRLIEYAKSQPPNAKSSSFWISQGELRFIIVRKAMEAFYSLTGADDIGIDEENQQLPSYFCDLMQHSWGVVSRPAFKNFSLRVSKLLKGASVADRIEIAGVPCFVVSRHPCPELAAAIKRFHRKDRRRLSVQNLSTINEDESAPITPPSSIPKKLFAGTNDRYRQQDIIFHCTGGGYFAHMIAFDLLYLLEWSASTGAVIICPEYVLLPDHPFPRQLQEITQVYKTLVSGDAVSTLGFEVNSIAVTGESTGGNLAAALCVNLCLDRGDSSSILEQQNRQQDIQACSSRSVSDSDDEYSFPEHATSCSGSSDQGESCRSGFVRLPDALMLSSAVLNMSLELSHSRVVGTEDPVLPSGVLNAISDAYLPANLGISKTHYLASPMYAPDSILARFPPTLLFASSNDPLLDDSIAFNHRLRSLNVESEIRAVQNVPHAFWGLDLVNFPEAKQVHRDAKEWLADKITREKESTP